MCVGECVGVSVWEGIVCGCVLWVCLCGRGLCAVCERGRVKVGEVHMDLCSSQVVRKGLEEGPIAGYEAEAQVRNWLHMRTWGTVGLPSISNSPPTHAYLPGVCGARDDQ